MNDLLAPGSDWRYSTLAARIIAPAVSGAQRSPDGWANIGLMRSTLDDTFPDDVRRPERDVPPERRVAMVPGVIPSLKKIGVGVVVETGRGRRGRISGR